MHEHASSPREAGVANTNGVELAWEARGDPAAPPILLLMGLGTPLTGWPEPFCDALAQAGFRVIRFDNRDVGASTILRDLPPYDSVRAAFLKTFLGRRVNAPYALDAMAADTVGLLDALGIERAHLVGASMGGMIAQTLAARYPARVTSLTSIMSSSGHRKLPRARWKVLLRLGSRPKSRDTEAIVAHLVTTMRMIGSPNIQNSREQWAEQIRASVARGYHPAGTARQLLAILSSGSRTWLLRKLDVPALVIHGDADPLVPLAHGRHTAECLPGARLEVLPGMGHDLPPPLHEKLADLITAHARAAIPAGAARA